MTPRGRALLLLLLLLLLGVSPAPAEASSRYDPRLRFRTVSVGRFDIHFHQGEEAEARRLAGFIEEAAAGVDASIGPPDGRVQVILVDQDDLSNGWATPLPYNTIEINAAAPSASSIIGNTDDWLRLVFVHEYAHIAHLSRAGGWAAGLRKVFGRMPLLFPNLFQPVWGIEGIATWQESAATGAGRVPAGDFRLLLDRAAAAGMLEPLDRVNGGNVDWPSGNTPYLYGAYFHEYLAGRYGKETLRRLADETSRQLPFLASRAYRRVYGRSLGELWREFAEAVDERAAGLQTDTRGTRLTTHGFIVAGPRFTPKGRLFYSVRHPHGFPALMEWRGEAGAPRRVVDRYGGTRIGVAGDGLIVDDLELEESVALRSDLYLIDPDEGTRQRLTRGARALDPDVAPDGRTVAFTIQMSDRRALATLALTGGRASAPDLLISEPGTHVAAPAWSPDGKSIAIERRARGRRSEIVLVNPRNGQPRVLASLPDGRAATPAWMPDGRALLFAAARGREPFRIYRVTLETGELAVLEGTGASALAPAVSPDGTTLVYVGYTEAGYDLFSLPLAGAHWTPVPVAAPAGTADPDPVRDAPPPAWNPREYSPLPTLAPRFWTPIVESDGDELMAGALTAGADVLGRHAYMVQGGWSTRARPDWFAAYTYDRWRPILFASASDDTDPFRDGELRAREANAGLLLRADRLRSSLAALAAWHVARERLECTGCAALPGGTDRTRSAIRAGGRYSSARSYGYSISAEEGTQIALTAEVPSAALGSDGTGWSLTADARRYLAVRPRHAVLAVRAAGASSWGDERARQLFSAAGSGPQGGGFGFGLDAIGLLRGYEPDAVVGTRAATASVDLRLPLRRIDRGIGTVPLFARVVHGALFVDAGQAWFERARPRDLRTAAGIELSVDLVVGFELPVTFTAGAAWRRDGRAGARDVAVFGRVGRAF